MCKAAMTYKSHFVIIKFLQVGNVDMLNCYYAHADREDGLQVSLMHKKHLPLFCIPVSSPVSLYFDNADIVAEALLLVAGKPG